MQAVVFALAVLGLWTLLQGLCQLLRKCLPRNPMPPVVSDDDDSVEQTASERAYARWEMNELQQHLNQVRKN